MAKILIVDDDRGVVHIIRQLLAEHGYETSMALNGLGGLELFQTQFFDLIITDLKMPGMDGLSFLREVRQLEPAMPVIILTAYGSLNNTSGTAGEGAFIHLAKPFQADELLSVVRHVLSAGQLGRRIS